MYHLELPPSATIHNVFHVSQLKKVGVLKTVQPTLPELTDDFKMKVQPEMIMGRRWNLERRKEGVLIKWENQPDIEGDGYL